MSELSNLKPPEGANQESTRKGRGPGSGQGKTCGRGTKGQKARSGGQIPTYFEGGQTPLYRQLPKYGFKNPTETDVAVVNVGKIARQFEDGDEIDVEALVEGGHVRRSFDELKVLGEGEIDIAVTVRVHQFSESAREKIEAAGGTAEVV